MNEYKVLVKQAERQNNETNVNINNNPMNTVYYNNIINNEVSVINYTSETNDNKKSKIINIINENQGNSKSVKLFIFLIVKCV